MEPGDTEGSLYKLHPKVAGPSGKLRGSVQQEQVSLRQTGTKPSMQSSVLVSV